MRKVFISYYHEEDQQYKDALIKKFDKKAFLDNSVGIGHIDDSKENTERIYQIIRDHYLKDASVTIVLLGKNTCYRKYVDWEIYSSLRSTNNNARMGLLGILLPKHPCYNNPDKIKESNTQKGFVDNYKTNHNQKRYAVLLKWSDVCNNQIKLERAINKAYKIKKNKKVNPVISRKFRKHNKDFY